jgi:antitoxin component YwqK of YwqJK toxin-antitoxin module
MRLYLIIFIISSTFNAYAQKDTTRSIYENLKTKKFYSVSMRETTQNGVTVYFINNKQVSKNTYHKYEKTWNNMETCTPCILERFNESGILLNKAVSYTDCIVGQYIEYFENGKIKIIGHFKENDTGLWDNISDRGFCSVKHGIWNYYNENGLITKTEFYNEDLLIEK